MRHTAVTQRFLYPETKLSPDEYNYAHFRTRHLWREIKAVVETRGIPPGAMAPDFKLPRADGGSLRLTELRGKPTLLHFGSLTRPIAIGSVEPLKQLHARWGDRVHFVDVLTRQAHPGPDVPAYRSFDQKMQDVQRYQQEEGIPWPVVVDELEGPTHQVYGGLSDPTYVLDTEGRVAFYNVWTHVPTLHEAIDALLKQGGRGVVMGGRDRLPHLLAAITDGWEALRRGLPQSFIDLETAAPGVASSVWLGHQLRPLLAPLTLRAQPLPVSVKIGLAVGATALLLLGVQRLGRSGEQPMAQDRGGRGNRP